MYLFPDNVSQIQFNNIHIEIINVSIYKKYEVSITLCKIIKLKSELALAEINYYIVILLPLKDCVAFSIKSNNINKGINQTQTPPLRCSVGLQLELREEVLPCMYKALSSIPSATYTHTLHSYSYYGGKKNTFFKINIRINNLSKKLSQNLKFCIYITAAFTSLR